MSNQTKKVLIIRHGEKPGEPGDENAVDGPDLSPRGHVRAAALAKHFVNEFGRPDFIFATAGTKHSNRPVQTIKPLARETGIEINAKHADDEFQKVAREILDNTKYSGKLILICWHHGKIPKLTAALGGISPEEKWDEKVFDRIWQLEIPHSSSETKVTVVNAPQMLLFGDSKS